ncbi:ABC transporter permease [Actinomyces sp. 594]|uniref:ABC transporter permease n=1 Tax=Actinomyces sp. 594 TaxID=2057793 RepID=UPI001C56D2F3|nr:ABC transporter permease [Actinomyces sp. 594]MBW3069143.1 ABC transporter permease [Actinomyces sp. 594]
MRTVFRYQVLRLLRDRILLLWTLGMPIALSLMFMMMFSGLEAGYAVDPIRVGIVHDDAYAAEAGLDGALDAVSADDAELRLLDPVAYDTAEQAEAAVQKGDTVGYIAVQDGTPVLHLSPEGNDLSTTPVLRAMLDTYVHSRDEITSLIAAEAPPADAAAAVQDRHAFTTELQVTRVPGKPEVPYYFALLAFTSGMGMTIAVVAIREITAPSGHLAARRNLGALPRWRLLLGTLSAAWVCTWACLVLAFVFMRFVVGVDFGPYAALCLLAIGISSLMACAAGSVLGTFPRMPLGGVSAISCLLALFCGLYGTASQRLANAVELSAPLVSQLNPLWQATRCFYGLLYYDSLEPFARSCTVLAGMTLVFFIIAMIRMRRTNHEHL